jgi:hypothetical protein
MPSKTRGKGSSGQSSTSKTGDGAGVKRGKEIPNLVVSRDSGDEHVEFRVQCEVWLTPDEADHLDKLLKRPRTSGNLDDARDFVLARVHPQATEAFRRIIRIAFDDQPEHMGTRKLAPLTPAPAG